MVQGKTLTSAGLMFTLALSLVSTAWGEPAQAQSYVTWGIFEPDKCASIWLIKRHIDPEARFVFIDRDDEPPPGIQFDTPEAKFRRYHNKCTYETFLDHHGLSDARLVYIGRLMHDIEVNVWERKAMEETQRVEAEILQLLSDEAPQKTVDACVRYFDEFYAALGNQKGQLTTKRAQEHEENR